MDVDYYSVDSETIETLNILRPPVKRVCRNTRRNLIDYLIGDSNSVNVARDYTYNYKAEKKKTSKHTKRTAESSLSLVLEKICKREIFDNYLLLNSKSKDIEKIHSHNNVCKTEDKPLIRVSVIPKTYRKPSINLLESHKGVTRTLLKPIAKDEHSIQTKNLYVVVEGKREKIYEIKTTGSDTYFRDSKNEGVNELYVKKRRSKFPKMERKKNESGRKQDKDVYPKNTLEPCICKCTQHNVDHDTIYPGNSRVKIVGRIGRNKDDTYVMNCAATVNGHPVSTNVVKVDDNVFYKSLTADSNLGTTKESQGTQVDISVNFPHDCPTCDRNIQCNAFDVTGENDCEISRINDLKATKSPLVIISVYPKQESNTFVVNTKPNVSPPERSIIQNLGPRQTKKENLKVLDAFTVNTDIYNNREMYHRKRNNQSYRPLNAITNTQNNESDEIPNNKVRHKKTTITKTYRASRSVSPANRSPKSLIQERKKQITMDTSLVKSDAKYKSPNRISVKEKRRQSLTDISKRHKSVLTNKKAEKQQSPRSRSVSKSRDKSVNTNAVQINNTLQGRRSKKSSKNKTKSIKKNIENKTDKPKDNQALNKKSCPNNNISKVSINIDSEKEYYDVIFEKGKRNTDLIVRQTTKENGAQKYFEEKFDDDFEEYFNENRKSDSLENFFPVEAAGHHRRSVSQAFNNVLVDAIPSSEHTSRLNVRDSLEINHRRDEKDSKAQENTRIFEYDSNEDNDEVSFARLKHYTGDNCIISDPIERDKQIRKLLGVNKMQSDSDQTVEIKHNVSRSRPMSRHSLFQHTLCQSLTAKLMLQRSCSCYSCTRTEMALASDCNISHKVWMENSSTELQEKGTNLTDLVTKSNEQVKENDTKYINRGQIIINNRHRVPCMVNQITQYNTLEKSLKNHDIQDFLNVGPCSKRKAIMLSRTQYNKIRRTIQKLSDKRRKIKPMWNSSIISIGDVKAKNKSEYLMHWNKGVQTDANEVITSEDVKKLHMKELQEAGDNKKNTIVLFTRHREDAHIETINKEVRKVTSSVEIRRYTSISYLKEPTCSITNVGSLGTSNLERKQRLSIETIFRGHRKSHTPNLGASALSLLTENVKSVSTSEKTLCSDSKQKKPFLRRLMSCLVMRAGKSVVKIDSPKTKPSMNSSYDSYHISTSLGAIEMSSSLYDTSMSFYSNHTIGHIDKKMKRGFFSSVRGFLATRKS